MSDTPVKKDKDAWMLKAQKENIERLSEEAKSIYSIDPNAVIKTQIKIDELPNGLRGKNDRISRFIAPFREIEKRLKESPDTAIEINIALFNGRTPGGHVQSVLRKNFPNLKMVQRAKRVFLILKVDQVKEALNPAPTEVA